MKITKTTKLADRVLRELRKLDGPNCSATPYVNGREKGWTLFPEGVPGGSASGVTFAEFRSTDNLVVYQGTNPYTNGPTHLTEEAYKDAQFFNPEKPDGAARAISAMLRAAIRRAEEARSNA